MASFNVENYLVCDRLIDGKYTLKYPKPEYQKEALRKLVKEINPDVLALQEMGSEPFLKELQKDLKSEGIDFPYLTLTEAKDPSRHIALLSKLPFKSSTHFLSFDYQKKQEYVKRGLLEVEFENNSHTWKLFVVHLKSKRDTTDDKDSSLFRELEAKTVAQFLRKKLSNKDLYMVVGDFNDSKSSQTLKYFTRLPLQNLPHKDSRSESWTYRFGKEDLYIRHDYIFPSKSFKSFMPKLEISIADGPESLVASDHRMIYSDIVFGQK